MPLDILTTLSALPIGASPYFVWVSAANFDPPALGRYLEEMRSRQLLTQVLAANLLLITATVITAGIVANVSLADEPQTALVFGIAIAITVLVNVLLLQRRFRPLERLVDEMERADLVQPGANLRNPTFEGGPEEVQRLPAHAGATRGGAAARLERGPDRPGAGARTRCP
jgi:hypothetical protein